MGLWNSSEEDGNVRSVGKMKAPSVKMNIVTLIGKGRWNRTCFVYKVGEIISNIFFLSRHFLFWGFSCTSINTFSLGRHAFWGGVVLD